MSHCRNITVSFNGKPEHVKDDVYRVSIHRNVALKINNQLRGSRDYFFAYMPDWDENHWEVPYRSNDGGKTGFIDKR